MRNIPFFPNTGDGTHCWQAALKMVLAVFEPDREYSYDELDRISEKSPGKWTWPTAAMLWFLKRGYELQLIEDFDYGAFAEQGEDYLLERCGKEVGQAQIANTDLAKELGFAREFSTIAPLDVRIPGFEDLKAMLEQGYGLICNINGAMLSGQKGYAGHFVVITGMTQHDITLHDPGLPPQPHLQVPRHVFDRAWSYPTPRDRNLLAIRKKCSA
ncbi:MAG: hypothetical protein HY540_06635 [Deltaproteobacteria bacterium]|nr:hypothetical protein [Deltaproteobacteria bacterium]